MAFREVVIVSACRTAIGKFLGSLRDVPARDLAITAGRAAIERAGISAEILDECCMGQVFPPERVLRRGRYP
jgi:acetyl-CoA C-acetyltransferase